MLKRFGWGGGGGEGEKSKTNLDVLFYFVLFFKLFFKFIKKKNYKLYSYENPVHKTINLFLNFTIKFGLKTRGNIINQRPISCDTNKHSRFYFHCKTWSSAFDNFFFLRIILIIINYLIKKLRAKSFKWLDIRKFWTITALAEHCIE